MIFNSPKDEDPVAGGVWAEVFEQSSKEEHQTIPSCEMMILAVPSGKSVQN